MAASDLIGQAELAEAQKKRSSYAMNPYRSRAHEILIFFMLLHIVVCSARLFSAHALLFVGNLIAWSGIIGFGVYAAFRQLKTDLPRSMKAITWTMLVYCCFHAYFINVHAALYRPDGPQAVLGLGQYLYRIAKVAASGSIWVTGRLVASVFFTSVLTVTGTIVMQHFKKAVTLPPPIPAGPEPKPPSNIPEEAQAAGE